MTSIIWSESEFEWNEDFVYHEIERKYDVNYSVLFNLWRPVSCGACFNANHRMNHTENRLGLAWLKVNCVLCMSYILNWTLLIDRTRKTPPRFLLKLNRLFGGRICSFQNGQKLHTISQFLPNNRNIRTVCLFRWYYCVRCALYTHIKHNYYCY